MQLQLNLNDFHNDWAKLVGKAIHNYQLLSPDERIWYNIQALKDAVDNGGLISYYYNDGANHLSETIADLKTIGADNIVALLQQVNQLFPDEVSALSINERNNVISTWEDGAFDDLLNKLDAHFYKEEPTLETALIEHIVAKGIIRHS